MRDDRNNRRSDADARSRRNGRLRHIGLRQLLMLTRHRGLVARSMAMVARWIGRSDRRRLARTRFAGAQRRALGAGPQEGEGQHSDELCLGQAHPKKIIAPFP